MDFDKLQNVDLVIYHKNCHDGLASAAIYYEINSKVDFLPYQHGDDLPIIFNKTILILDISLPKFKLINLFKNNTVYLVDHHLPTEELIPLFNSPNFIHYDKSKCGALNFWYLVYPNEEPPIILSYVNDRDLWLNELPYYQEIFDGLTLEDKTVKNWNKLIFKSGADKFQQLVDKGNIIRKYVMNEIKYLETKSYIENFTFNNESFKVIYCNSSVLQSDLGNYLVTKYSVDFAAIYHYNGNIDKTIFSLRGKDKLNLSEVAKFYNGGGHFNASGCAIKGNVKLLNC